MMKTFKWVFVLTMLAGCAIPMGTPDEIPDSPTNPEPTTEVAITPERDDDVPVWEILNEIDFDLPTISTEFMDQSFGVATDIGGGIHLTHDGGQTWEYIQDAALSRVALEIVNENLIWHIGWYGPVIRSTDGGYTWQYLSSVPYSGHTEYTSFIDEDTGWAASTEMPEFWVTKDGAKTWTTYPLPEGMGTVAALHLRTSQDAYFLDLAGNLFVTTDGGETWSVSSIGLEDGWVIPELNHMAAMRFTDEDHGLIALNILGEGRGQVFVLRTSDGGLTWTKEELPVPMGMFHLSRDGVFLTHVDMIQHDKLTLLHSTNLKTGESFELNQDLSVRQIQEGVYIFTHAFPWNANSMAVVMGEHLVLVDTPWTPDATEEMLDWLVLKEGPKEVIAINTHFHIDNLGGNQYLVERGIPVYGSDLTAQLLADRGQASLDQTIAWLQDNEDSRYAETLAQVKLTPPSEISDIHAGLGLDFDGESLQVYYPGPAHAPDNVVVYFPERKLLFGGCMIIGWDAIGNTADADLTAWPESVRKLEQFEFEILVPGHGARLDPGLIEHTLELLSGVQ